MRANNLTTKRKTVRSGADTVGKRNPNLQLGMQPGYVRYIMLLVEISQILCTEFIIR